MAPIHAGCIAGEAQAVMLPCALALRPRVTKPDYSQVQLVPGCRCEHKMRKNMENQPSLRSFFHAEMRRVVGTQLSQRLLHSQLDIRPSRSLVALSLPIEQTTSVWQGAKMVVRLPACSAAI